VSSLSHSSLQNLAFDEIAVGVKAGAQVFVHRDQLADAHGFRIAPGAGKRCVNL
jgi:hypothetical protein